MTRYIRIVRAVSGFLSVLVLLSVVVAEIHLGATPRPNRIFMLLFLIAALLGVDLVSEHLPLEITVESGKDDAGTDTSETPEDDD